MVLGYGGLTLIGVGLFIRYLANPLVERLSRAPELLVSFAIGWAAALAALGHYLGFGKELGGLLAGVYSATVLYWVNDRSEGAADTLAFLERLDGRFRSTIG